VNKHDFVNLRGTFLCMKHEIRAMLRTAMGQDPKVAVLIAPGDRQSSNAR
jgi:hypothetical protein